MEITLLNKSFVAISFTVNTKTHGEMFAVTVESLRSALLESDSASKTERSKSYDEGLESYQDESRGSVRSFMLFTVEKLYGVLKCGPSHLDVLSLHLFRRTSSRHMPSFKGLRKVRH